MGMGMQQPAMGMGMQQPMGGMQQPMGGMQQPMGMGMQQQQMGGMGMGMGMGMQQQRPASIATSPMQPMASPPPMRPMSSSSSSAATPKSASAFDDLWSMSLGSGSKPSTPAAGPGKSIKDLQKDKATQGLWGAGG
ncbi:hypothetical protein BD626DRAFT_433565, partial [Schizophyllum amplum]